MAGTVTARCVINKQNVKVCYPPTTITSGVESVVAGTNITVDDTDPRNPIVSSTGGGGGITGIAPVGNLLRVLTVDGGGNVVTVEASHISEDATSIQAHIDGGTITWGAYSSITGDFGGAYITENTVQLDVNSARVKLRGIDNEIELRSTSLNGLTSAIVGIDATGKLFRTTAGGGTTTNPLTIGTGLSGTSFDGSAPVTIEIDATYAGQTSIVTLGTITTGVWNGTAIAAAYGGTGQSVYVVGDILSASSTTALSKIAAVAAGSYLRSAGTGTLPVWSTLTLPNTIASTSIPFATGANVLSSNTSFIYSQDAIKSLGVTGSNSARVSIEVQNTNSAGNASFYFQNNRGSFATYGGVLTCGSAEAGSLFGNTRADRTFLVSDGASSAGMGIGTLTADPLFLGTNNAQRVLIPSAGGVVIGTAALATSATDGFLYIPTCAGTPTGVPTAQTGTVPMIWDSTNKKFYIYDGSWLGGTAPGVFS